ncbi:MAG: hypothetical protein PHQ34_13805 [Methanothrix sp.]|nr:hypothetical protein [Methanothrix sp.]
MNNGNGRLRDAEFEPDFDSLDREHIPLPEAGGIDAFLRLEVRPHSSDALCYPASATVDYEIRFIVYICRTPLVRTLEEIQTNTIAQEKETGELLESVKEGGVS